MSFSGETVVFTGALEMKRADAQQKAKDAGAKVTGSISKNTTLVVAGKDAGSKLDTAKALGVKVITEAEFVDMLSGGGKKKPAAKKAPAKKATPAPAAAPSGSSSLSGKTIVFTGTMDTKRGTATQMATAAGAKVTGSVSGNTDILVAGAAAGSKLDAAKAKGIEIMTEAEFLEACNGGSSKKRGAGAGGAAAKKKKVEDDSADDDSGDLEAVKEAVLEKKDHMGFCEYDEDVFFARCFAASDLGFLRASAPKEAACDDVDSAYRDEPRLDEAEEDKRRGVARWNALKKAFEKADALTELFDEDFIEDNFLFLGYGDATPFAFCIPPGTEDGWDINEVLRAACHDEEEDGDDEEVFELQGAVSETFIPKAIEMNREDEDEEDEEDDEEKEDSRSTWLEKAKELPFFEKLLWAEHEWDNCDATNLVMYGEDHRAGIVYGTWIKRQW